MHWAWAVAQKPFDAAARQSFTREVAASHLVSPSRLQVARQSYILEVSHIHLCDWRRSLLFSMNDHRITLHGSFAFIISRQQQSERILDGIITDT